MAAKVLPFPRKVQTAENARSRSTELGVLGPENLSSILSEVGRGDIKRWANLCDRMVQLDGEIRADYVTRLAAVGAARWEMEPGPPTGDAAADAYAEQAMRFCEDQMRGLDDLSVYAMELLDAVGVSIAVSEIDYRWTGSHFGIERLRNVHQSRLRFGPDWSPRLVDFGGKRDLAGVPLAAYPGKFVVHQPREVATHPSMGGVLRACAWPYLFKRWATQFWVQGAERFAWPNVLGTVPRNTPEAARQKLQSTLESWTSEHVAVLDEGTVAKMIESTVKDAGTWRDLIAHLNGEFGKAILGSVDQSAPSEIGAWKAVESRKATTVDSRQAMDEMQLASTWRRDVLTWLCRYNAHLFGGHVPPVPRMRWIISEDRREIPSHIIDKGIVTRDQVLRSIGLDPVGPENGGRVLVGGSSDAGAGDQVGTVDKQREALNGAQVSSLLEIIQQVAQGLIPRSTGVQLIVAAFDRTPEQADEILAEVGRGFVPRSPDDADTQDVPDVLGGS